MIQIRKATDRGHADHGWLDTYHLRGAVNLNGQPLDTSDGAAVSEESTLEVVERQPAEIMLFDLD